MNTHPYDPTVGSIEVLKTMDELDKLGEDSKKLNIQRISCKCTLGKYKEAIELAEQGNLPFTIAILKFLEGDLTNAEQLFKSYIDKYSAKPYLTELEFERLLSSRIFVEGGNFDWESFLEEVYPQCIDIPDVEGLF